MASIETEMIVERLRTLADDWDVNCSEPCEDTYDQGYANGQVVAYSRCADALRVLIDAWAPPVQPKNRKPKHGRRR